MNPEQVPQQPVNMQPEPVQPTQPEQPQPATNVNDAATHTEDPGKVWGIISIIAPFVGLSLVGLILGIVGHVKSKKAGFKNTLATVGIILSSIVLVFTTIILAIVFFAAAATIQKCSELGPGTHYVNGVTYTCSN